jgi:hypothetical protein
VQEQRWLKLRTVIGFQADYLYFPPRFLLSSTDPDEVVADCDHLRKHMPSPHDAKAPTFK